MRRSGHISGADPGFDQGGGPQIVTGRKLPFWGLSFVEFWCWGLIFGGQGGGPGPPGPPPWIRPCICLSPHDIDRRSLRKYGVVKAKVCSSSQIKCCLHKNRLNHIHLLCSLIFPHTHTAYTLLQRDL